jgi:hypothetical protein
MGFGNRGGQQGKETYKLKLTNKKYIYYKLLESSKKVVGPVSTQALVDWRLGGNESLDSITYVPGGYKYRDLALQVGGVSNVAVRLVVSSAGLGLDSDRKF